MIGVANVSTRSVYASPGLVRPAADGRFSLGSLPPSTYLFYGGGSTAPGPATMGVLPLWAEVEVPLNGQDVSGVVLQFAPGRTVAGRLDFGGRAVPDLTGRVVALRPFPSIPGTNMPVPAGKLAPDGTFVFTGVAPGKYRARVQGIEGWSLRSAMFNGRDTLDAPLEVPRGDDIRDLTLVMTDRPTEVSGTVFDQLGRPTPEYAVFIFAADRSFWTTAPRRQSGAVKPDSAGKFVIRDAAGGGVLHRRADRRGPWRPERTVVPRATHSFVDPHHARRGREEGAGPAPRRLGCGGAAVPPRADRGDSRRRPACPAGSDRPDAATARALPGLPSGHDARADRRPDSRQEGQTDHRPDAGRFHRDGERHRSGDQSLLHAGLLSPRACAFPSASRA